MSLTQLWHDQNKQNKNSNRRGKKKLLICCVLILILTMTLFDTRCPVKMTLSDIVSYTAKKMISNLEVWISNNKTRVGRSWNIKHSSRSQEKAKKRLGSKIIWLFFCWSLLWVGNLIFLIIYIFCKFNLLTQHHCTSNFQRLQIGLCHVLCKLSCMYLRLFLSLRLICSTWSFLKS